VALVGRHRVRLRAVTLAAMAPRFPELQDAGWLRQRYELEGRSSYAIAAVLGCRATTVPGPCAAMVSRRGWGGRGGRARPDLGPVDRARRAARADPGRARLSLPLRVRARDRRAGGRAATGKDPLLRLRARRDKAARPAAQRAGRTTLRTAGRGARGGAREPNGRQDLHLSLRLRQHDDRSWRQPHERHTRSCGCLLEEYRRRGTGARPTAAGTG
jgi:hypothetical protein